MVEEEDVEFILPAVYRYVWSIKKCGNPEQQTDQSYGKSVVPSIPHPWMDLPVGKNVICI